MSNMAHWNNLKAVPLDALKEIGFGKLKGKSDINPQWRYEVMTKEFGVCGIGWKYEIANTWTQEVKEEILLFVQINLYIKDGEKWSEPIPAIGGDFVIERDKNGLHGNDEAYKMATTDALGVAMKMLGVAADVYRGLANDSKYGREKPQQQPAKQQEQKPVQQLTNQQQGIQQSNVKWPAFWANMKTFGLSEEEVHKIVSDAIQKDVTSLTEVITTQQELNKWTAILSKHKKTA